MLKRALFVKKFRKYKGSANQICKNIIKDCWNGTYFQTSTGHFTAFYIRDFCIATPGLMKLGYEKEVRKTLQYTLNIYSRNKTLTTTITKEAKSLHMFAYSPDSLPMLLKSLREAKTHDLIETYKPFIEEQTRWYLNHVMDEKTKLVNNRKWSSMKDNFRRYSSCYDNSMLAMLSEELDKLKLANPFKTFKIKQKMREALWSGQYFYDDMKRKRYIAGDANTFPYWCGVFKDPKMIKKSIESIRKAGLDRPWPLKYTRIIMRPMNKNIIHARI